MEPNAQVKSRRSCFQPSPWLCQIQRAVRSGRVLAVLWCRAFERGRGGTSDNEEKGAAVPKPSVPAYTYLYTTMH
jgi:hypothetical protein